MIKEVMEPFMDAKIARTDISFSPLQDRAGRRRASPDQTRYLVRGVRRMGSPPEQFFNDWSRQAEQDCRILLS